MVHSIVSDLFKGKGKLSKTLIRNLMVREGGVQITGKLQRHGWEGEDPVVTTVITIEENSGMIRGVRYETRGKGPTITFRANELWPEANEKIAVNHKFDDLSRLKWNTEGEKRNQTLWLGKEDVSFEAIHDDDGPVHEEFFEEYQLGGFSIRFTILPQKVNTAFMYGGIVPLSKPELEDWLKGLDVDTDLSSHLIPTVTMKLAFSKGRWQNALPMDLLPQEEDDEGVGLGHLPLLESIGARNPVFPKHEMVAKELSLFLRGTNPTNNVNPQAIRGILQGGTIPSSVTGRVTYEWPLYNREEDQSTVRPSVSG